MAKYLPKKARETALETHVRCWVNSYVKDRSYQDWQGVMKDLFYGGCESGMVTHLIYNYDCLKFAQKYLEDICDVIADYEEEYGELPFKKEAFSYTEIAWKGFELVAQKLAFENDYKY